MRIEPLGDAAYIVRDLGEVPAYIAASAVSAVNVRGLFEVVPAYDTLGAYVDPESFDVEEFRAALLSSVGFVGVSEGKLHTVPVCYELGEDLEGCCDELGMTESEFIAFHTGREYTCYAVGFAPGFTFLGYLPPEICGLSRLAAPRLVVPAGAVGVTGDQTGIYPGDRPGGWRLVGATPCETVNLREAYFPITAGDRVEFSAIRLAEYEARKGERL